MNRIQNIINKKNKSKIVSLTAYSKNIAKILDKHCDIVLVGDSLANVLYGQNNTHKIANMHVYPKSCLSHLNLCQGCSESCRI